MKKCKGCGIELQFEYKDLPGYSPNSDFDYCQRCFRLTHYGDNKNVTKNINDNKEIIKGYDKYPNALFVVVMDLFEGLIINEDPFIELFKDKPLLLIINKTDLVPRNINDEKLNDIFYKLLCKYPNVLSCILSNKNDMGFKDLFFETIKMSSYKEIVFVGRANAGKSTLINLILGNNDLSTSLYPGTTVSFNEIRYEGYRFIDSPGLIDEESFLTYLEKSKLKHLVPYKTIRPRTYQLYEAQSYSVEGLLAIDILNKGHCSITFYLNNELDVHRTKYSNREQYLKNNEKLFKTKLLPFKDHHYSVNGEEMFYLKGLGCFKIKGKGKINIRVNDRIKVYKNEVMI